MKLVKKKNLTEEQEKYLAEGGIPIVFIGDPDPAIWVDPGSMGDAPRQGTKLGAKKKKSIKASRLKPRRRF